VRNDDPPKTASAANGRDAQATARSARVKPPSCVTCGAPLPLKLHAPNLACPNCGALHEWNAELRRLMIDYVELVTCLVKREVTARFDAALSEQRLKVHKRLTYGPVAATMLLLVAFATSGTRILAIPLFLFVVWTIAWGASLFAITKGWIVMHRVARPPDIRAIGMIRCEGCGGSQSVDAGKVAVDCQHCHARLIVPRKLAADLGAQILQSSDRAVESARRHGDAVTRADEKISAPGVALLGTVVMAVFAVVAIKMRHSHDDAVDMGMVWLVAGVTGAAVWNLMARVRRSARRPFDEMIESLVQRAEVRAPTDDGGGLLVFGDPEPTAGRAAGEDETPAGTRAG
jgi:predicted RNA-binding Zn-ribbon protein involved in translation (DUF1610 family)